ncbi:hypothetical protein Tco_0353411 [Tanacetum coccineum]
MRNVTRSLTVVEETVAADLAKSLVFIRGMVFEMVFELRRLSQQVSIEEQENGKDILVGRLWTSLADGLKRSPQDTYAEWGQKLKGLAVDDPTVHSLLDLQKGSKASRLENLKQTKKPVVGEGSSVAHTKYYDNSKTDMDAILYSSCSDMSEESVNETNDADESDMDLTNDNLVGDDDAAGYGVFMHNKSTATPNSTYLNPTITSSSLNFIQTLLDETLANKLTDFMSHPVDTDAQTTSVVHNPEGNLKLTSYISGASEVPFGTHVDVLATKTLLQEMFPDEAGHYKSSPPENATYLTIKTPQPSSLQAKENKLMKRQKRI